MYKKEKTSCVQPNPNLLEDIQAEELLLANIIKHEENLIDAFTKIDENYFTQPHTKLVYGAIRSILSKDIPIDVDMVSMNIANDVNNSLIYNKIGGAQWLLTLVNNCVEKHYIPVLDRVIAAYLRRMVWDTSKEIEKVVTTDSELTKDGIVSLVERLTAAVTETSYDTGESHKLGDGIDSKLEFRRKTAGVIQGLATGIPTLDEITQGFRPGKLIVISANAKVGKALGLNTPIATPNGWTTMGEIKIGNQVFDENGNICNVIAVSEVMYNRKTYDVYFDKGCVIRADSRHEWLTMSHNERVTIRTHTAENRIMVNEKRRIKMGYKKRRTQQYINYDYLKPSIGNIRTTEELAKNIMYGKHYNYTIETNKALNLPEISLPIDPYILGVWLGDGTSLSGQITTADTSIIKEIKKRGFETTKHKNRYAYGILELKNILKNNKLLKNKHIPTIYLRASRKQRLDLLQGLMDTDGTCSKRGRCTFYSTKKELIEGFLELLNSLGIKGKIKTKKAMLKGKDYGICYLVGFVTTAPVFKLKRKLIRQKTKVVGEHHSHYIRKIIEVPSEPVKCIQVDSASNLYLAGEHMIPTHNSILVANFAKTIGIDQQRPCLIISTEMSASEDEDRILAITSGVGEQLIRNGLYAINEEYVAAVNAAKEKLKASYILHEWRPVFTIEEIESLCKKYYVKYGVNCIFFDYIKCSMAKNMGAVSEWQFLGFLTYALKNIATKLKIPVIATAQLNRQAVGEFNIEQDKIGGSLRIIQTANTVFALRPPVKKEREENKNVNLYMEILCNRDGFSGITIRLNKHEDNGRIQEVQY